MTRILKMIGLAFGLTIGTASAEPFQSFIYTGVPDLSSYHLQTSRTVYEGEFWPPGANRTNPDVNFIKNSLIPQLKSEHLTAFIIDIERWQLVDISKYITVAKTLRSGLPGVKFGFYGTFPERSYWAFNGDPNNELAGLQARNVQWAQLAVYTDFTFPSLYTFYTDQPGWVKYAAGMTSESRRYSHPVYPFLWPQYHDSNPTLRFQFIAADYWDLQLRTTTGIADGFVLWGGVNSIGVVPWSTASGQPWWPDTITFLSHCC